MAYNVECGGANFEIFIYQKFPWLVWQNAEDYVESGEEGMNVL